MSDKKNPFDLPAEAPPIAGNLRPPPKFADRISSRVLKVTFGVVVFLAILFMYSLDSMDRKNTVKIEEESDVRQKIFSNIDDAMPKDFKDDVGPSSLVSKEVPITLKPPAPFPVDSPESAAMQESPPPPPPLTLEEQMALQEKQARLARMSQARLNGMAGKVFGGTGGAGVGDGGAQGSAVEEKLDFLVNFVRGVSGSPGEANVGGGSGSLAPGVNPEQNAKLNFINKAASDDRGYHRHVSIPALSRNEIKTGSFIPMTLETSINSDLPGMITARISENIYDSITGCRMLIPAMSKVVGKYDSNVALGQNRMLVAWNTVVFPDGAELNLAGMQGYDTSGMAGFEADVDNHYWQLFGVTLGLSLISAGVQSSAPPTQTNRNGSSKDPTAAQNMASALAQNYGQLGAQILGKYMAVQPTLRNFSGERFMVMVPRTIVFAKPWAVRCAG